MQICYWSPFLTHIATVDAVKNSAISVKKYLTTSERLQIKILNSCGEWNFFKNNKENIDVYDMQKINLYKILPKKGFILSRLSFIVVFLLNLIPLLKFIKREKPDFIIIHLLTILPIILSPYISKKTKIILRVSGLPNMHFFRKFIWRFFSRYIFLITTPTNLTKELLINYNIFNSAKIKLLRDPIVNCKNINYLKKKKIEFIPTTENFYLSIGRLTEQKNFEFLVNTFAKNYKYFNIKNLIIIGEGEKFSSIKKIIYNNNAENNIFLIGFKENVYNYINKSSALISTALYEDPGFALIESCYMRKKIITSLVNNGPKEMYNDSRDMCYFFQNNNEKDLIEKILSSENDINEKSKITKSFYYTRDFTLYNHYRTLISFIK
jgi:glycosyltransferase involved in cell wall biosynthesis